MLKFEATFVQLCSLSECKCNMDNDKFTSFTWRTQVVQMLPQIIQLDGHSSCIDSL